ncbi:MAG: methyltransferase domain-containing protein [Pseudomonadota bacterium]
MSVAEKWNARYAAISAGAQDAAWVLREHTHLLPADGDALDLACGLGGNVLLLAERGLKVSAWDVSAVAIERLRLEAARRSLSLEAAVRDVVQSPPAPASADVIVVAHFLERALFPALLAALRPGGLLFYQTFTRERPAAMDAPTNPDFLLQPNELRQLCAPLSLLHYFEEGELAQAGHPLAARAALVGRRA